jgi:hypothetical protein
LTPGRDMAALTTLLIHVGVRLVKVKGVRLF